MTTDQIKDLRLVELKEVKANRVFYLLTESGKYSMVKLDELEMFLWQNHTARHIKEKKLFTRINAPYKSFE